MKSKTYISSPSIYKKEKPDGKTVYVAEIAERIIMPFGVFNVGKQFYVAENDLLKLSYLSEFKELQAEYKTYSIANKKAKSALDRLKKQRIIKK